MKTTPLTHTHQRFGRPDSDAEPYREDCPECQKNRTPPAHTPGPWVVKPDPNGKPYHWVKTEGGYVIARVPNGGDYGNNARLVAQAPAMYEALQQCKEAMNAHMRRYGPTPNIVTAENIAASILQKIESE
jgi:hypothetical protein